MERYEDIHALNWSSLKLMATSPAYAKHNADHPEERSDKDSYRLGRAVHCALLEPLLFLQKYIRQPKFGDLRTKKAKEEKARFLSGIPNGAEVVSANEYDIALRCVEAVKKHDAAIKLFEGAQFEQTALWTDPKTGIKCKGRIDISSNRIIDVKTTRHATVSDILRDAAKFDYHGQVAWYHDGATRAGIIGGHFLPAMICINVSMSSSFVDVAVFDMGYATETFEAGRLLYEDLLEQYAGCKAANWWPGMAPHTMPWELPPWKL